MRAFPVVPHRWLLPVTILGLTGLAYVLYLSFHGSVSPPQKGPTQAVEVVWAFEAARRGAILTTPLAAEDRIFVAALHDTAFVNAGAVYCLERATGKQVWRFDDGGKMQHTYSSPCLADGRLYVGEGMHANFVCKLYCLDAASGRKLWDFVAEGHIQSSPCVAGGKVFFGAGDDGIWCLDAATGAKCWQFRGPFHIDSSPAVSGRHLYFGSGVSRTHKTTAAFCLDTEDGKVLWRLPTELPVWGSPVVFGEDVFFGLGNGRLLTSPAPPEKPAGGVLRVRAETGESRWCRDVGDAVLARVAVDERHVFCGAHDGVCYCLDRDTGQLCWKQELGSPVVTSPALLGERLYVVASGGRICCLDVDSGRSIWSFDVAGYSQASPQLLSSPAVVANPGPDGAGRRIYFGAELRYAGSNAAVVYCLRD